MTIILNFYVGDSVSYSDFSSLSIEDDRLVIVHTDFTVSIYPLRVIYSFLLLNHSE